MFKIYANDEAQAVTYMRNAFMEGKEAKFHGYYVYNHKGEYLFQIKIDIDEFILVYPDLTEKTYSF